MIDIKIDIVGGGLAGLSSAISLKKQDRTIKVIVHEKHKKIGYNIEGRRCGEGHTVEAEWKQWKPEKKSYFNQIDTVLTYAGNKKYRKTIESGIGYMLNRQEFIHQLGGQAEKLGVEIQKEDKISSIDDLDGEYIIDASGCPSTIKRDIGIDKGIRGLSYQQTIEDSNCFISDTIKVFFSDTLGYYWIFPRNPIKKEINVGVGTLYTSKNVQLKKMLGSFKKEQGIQGKINYVTGGLIPAGLQRPLKFKNILFVGDAGVGTHPILGKGIYRALYSGEIAANCIVDGKIERYPRIITSEFIKWDIIGKNYIRISWLLNKIGVKALQFFYRIYLDTWYALN